MWVCVGCGNFLHRPQIVAKLIMKVKELPPVEVLNELLIYEPDTGKLINKIRRSRRALQGKENKTVSGGYITVCIDSVTYQSHRIIWKMMTGEDPLEGYQIDHINRDRADNRWCNLRLVTHQGNSRNRNIRSDNKSGHAGVYSTGRKRSPWAVTLNGAYLGAYATLEDAIEARRAAECAT